MAKDKKQQKDKKQKKRPSSAAVAAPEPQLKRTRVDDGEKEKHAVPQPAAAAAAAAVSPDDRAFTKLTEYLARIPSVSGSGLLGHGTSEDGNWWVKFTIDVDHPQAWNTVQELGHVLNYLSLGERLPTVFMPTSPPPYMNGSAREFLSWVIESSDPNFQPETCADWLEGRLPRPVDDLSQWPDPDESESGFSN